MIDIKVTMKSGKEHFIKSIHEDTFQTFAKKISPTSGFLIFNDGMLSLPEIESIVRTDVD